MADVQSLKRAFDILRAVSGHADGVGLAVLSRQVGLPKSTVARMLTTLENLGAVERTHDADGYQIGTEIVALASQVAYPRTLVAIARPYLQELAQVAGETVSLGVPEGDQMYYLDQIDSWHNLRLKNWVGSHLPMYATSDGKLVLAHWPTETLHAYLRRPLHPYSPNTVVDPNLLHQELAQIRANGFAWNQREYDPDIVSLAAPIVDEVGNIIATVCLFGPFFRFPPEDRRTEFIQQTVDTARKISERLHALGQRTHIHRRAA